MKQLWQRLSLWLDVMTLRERALVFIASAAGLLFFVDYVALEPLYRQQKVLLASINQQRNLIAGVDAEITRQVEVYSIDPDVVGRARLKKLTDDAIESRMALAARQNGLVAPEKIVSLLENILKGNGKVRLVSLKTLTGSAVPLDASPAGKEVKPSDQGQPAAEAAPAPVPALAAPGTPARTLPVLYRHGVELVVQGGYPDLVDYMAALEAMPSRLFWGNVRLNVAQYPQATLTLSLYTISLDKQWMKL